MENWAGIAGQTTKEGKRAEDFSSAPGGSGCPEGAAREMSLLVERFRAPARWHAGHNCACGIGAQHSPHPLRAEAAIAGLTDRDRALPCT
jgi:hypothetical protein